MFKGATCKRLLCVMNPRGPIVLRLGVSLPKMSTMLMLFGMAACGDDAFTSATAGSGGSETSSQSQGGTGGVAGAGGSAGAGGDGEPRLGSLAGPIAGLRYETDTLEGYTSEAGAFEYRDGEQVRFFLGDELLGTAAAGDNMTLFDLAATDPPLTVTEVRTAINHHFNTRHAVAFDHAVNLATLLYSVDDDSDPDNGIQVPEALHGLASGMDLQLKRRFDSFDKSLSFRTLIGLGREAQLWGGTKFVIPPGRALDALYTTLGLVPEIDVATEAERDQHADGSIDTNWSRTFGPTGELLSEESSWSSVYYGFDALGNYSQVDRDHDADMTVDERLVFERDANGWEKKRSFDEGVDGTLEYVMTLSYDVFGNEVERSEDFDADGSINWHWVKSYDQRGRLVSVERDEDMDGMTDHHVVYEYDNADNLVSEARDTDGDGIVNIRFTMTYDAMGRLMSRGTDGTYSNEIADGTVNSLVSYLYDANGNRIREERDYDVDGQSDRTIVWQYDAVGHQVLEERDNDGDGTLELRLTTTYDTLGNVASIEYDPEADGVVTTRHSHSYDARGSLTTIETYDHGLLKAIQYFAHEPINRWRGVFDELIDN